MNGSDHETDDGVDVGMDERVLYEVVTRAVEDAILNAAGTLLLVAVTLTFAWVGAAFAVSAVQSGAVGWAVVGGAVAVGAGYIAASTLDLVPPVRELI